MLAFFRYLLLYNYEMTGVWRSYRVFLTPIVTVIVVLGHLATPSLAVPFCSGLPIAFAHCDESSRNYRSVLIAIHGWNGDCKTTFGKNEKSLFKVIEQKFFDIDCFEYDSLNLSIDENARKFGDRLKFLHDKGYREAMLVTHSTGGIIALRYLTLQFLYGNELSPEGRTRPIHSDNQNGLYIRAIHAWATPINGTKRLASIAGGIARVTFSPETIKDLKPGSPFLNKLQTDLARLRSLMEKSRTGRARLQIPITFYQGQTADGIVRNISVPDAQNTGWWPYGAKLVHTASGHSHNIGRSGKIGLPQYPAEITALGALIELSLTPRLDRVFPESGTQGPDVLEGRQLGVIGGISNYARRLFLDAFEPLSDFLKRIVDDLFPRNPRVDDEIASTLAQSVEDELLGPLSERHISFFDKLVTYIFGDFEIRGDGNLTRFGEGRSTVTKHILTMLELIRKRINRYLDTNPSAETALTSSGSRMNFNVAILNVQSRMLKSRFGPVQNAALQVFEKSIAEYSPDELKSANFFENFNTYNKANYAKFNADNRKSVAKVYGDIIGKGSALAVPTYTFLNQRVDWLGTERPLWTALLDDATVKDILKKTVARQGVPTTPEFNFTSAVIAESGPTGNNLAASKLALEKAQELLSTAPAERQKFDWIQQLSESGTASDYPAIQSKVNAAIVNSIK